MVLAAVARLFFFFFFCTGKGRGGGKLATKDVRVEGVVLCTVYCTWYVCGGGSGSGGGGGGGM